MNDMGIPVGNLPLPGPSSYESTFNVNRLTADTCFCPMLSPPAVDSKLRRDYSREIVKPVSQVCQAVCVSTLYNNLLSVLQTLPRHSMQFIPQAGLSSYLEDTD